MEEKLIWEGEVKDGGEGKIYLEDKYEMIDMGEEPLLYGLIGHHIKIIDVLPYEE